MTDEIVTTHTPGPWRVGTGSFVIADAPAPGIGGSADVDYYGGHLIAESINGPNARLIAAAPDLLEALKYVMSAHVEQLPYACEQAERAIAKAEAQS